MVTNQQWREREERRRKLRLQLVHAGTAVTAKAVRPFRFYGGRPSYRPTSAVL